MSIVVRVASANEKEVVQNIDQFYLYEFSRFMPDYYRLGDDGFFHDEDYASYWADDNKFPYLILKDDELAGFALVEDIGKARVLSQFFVLYKFQGSGAARIAAMEVLLNHPGEWVVQSLLKNPKSEGFWPKVISELTKNTYTVGLQEPRKTHHEYRFTTYPRTDSRRSS